MGAKVTIDFADDTTAQPISLIYRCIYRCTILRLFCSQNCKAFVNNIILLCEWPNLITYLVRGRWMRKKRAHMNTHIMRLAMTEKCHNDSENYQNDEKWNKLWVRHCQRHSPNSRNKWMVAKEKTTMTLWIVPMAKFLESNILFTIIHFSGSLSLAPTTFTEYDVHEFNAKFQTRCKIKSCKQSFEMWHQLKIKYS